MLCGIRFVARNGRNIFSQLSVSGSTSKFVLQTRSIAMTGKELEKVTIDTVKATAPLVAENANAITTRFYSMMFDDHPELRSIFNMSNHRPSKDGLPSAQARALSFSVIAYASNIENLGALGDAVELISEKHVSLHIQPEHYLVVGEYLLKAIKEVLGDVATDPILDEWKKAVFFLAGIFIDVEKKKYDTQLALEGGWNGFKELVVTKKEKESKNVTSFYFSHVDGSKMPDNFIPGQYLAITIPKAAFGGKYDHDNTRNYSLSCAPGKGYLRCSIGRSVDGHVEEQSPYYGAVSNYMHDNVNEGDKILVSMPRGHFTLKDHGSLPLVMVAAGIGLTPIISMIDFLAKSSNRNPDQVIKCIQVERSPEEHSMKNHIDKLAEQRLLTEAHVFYTRNSAEGKQLQNTTIHPGRPSFDSIKSIVGKELHDAEFYFCGPGGFMNNFEEMLDTLEVPKSRRHSERFGPELAGNSK